MSDDKLKVDLDTAPHLARLIYDVAVWQIRCAPVGSTSDQLKVKAEDIREAANLVFLTLDLIQEWKTRC